MNSTSSSKKNKDNQSLQTKSKKVQSKSTFKSYKETNKHKLQSLANKIDDQYISEVFEAIQQEDKYRCTICKTITLGYKSIRRHIIESESHVRALNKEEDKVKHNGLRNKLIVNKESDDSRGQKENDGLKKNYLEFIGVCLKAKLSFRQINIIGEHLKSMQNQRKLDFFSSFNFSEGELSRIANVWGDYLHQQLLEDLCQSKYSLIVDNSTIAGKNICAIEVRYVKYNIISEQAVESSITNRVVGLKYLEDSSSGETIYKILKERLINLNELIQENLVGVTHDRGSNLTGSRIGMMAYLKKNEYRDKMLLDFNDPCHSIHNAIRKSLDSLPEDVMNFIEKIHTHFSKSPQRVSLLMKLQQNEGQKELNLVHYLENRWLSLGLSLERLLTIWPSLKIYMEKPNPPGINVTDHKLFKTAFADQSFHIRIIFLSSIVKKVSSYNRYFQDQKLEVDNLWFFIESCIKEIAFIFMNKEKIPKDLASFSDLNWDEDDLYIYKMDKNNFVENMKRELNENLKDILLFPSALCDSILEYCHKYLKSLVKWLTYYLPIQDELLRALDFISLPQNSLQMKQNILNFNRKFKLIPEDQENLIIAEINDLMKLNINWIRVSSQNSSLKMWDFIESTFNNIDKKTKKVIQRFPLLSIIFRTVHAFPTSSANVEQVFSLMKLLKSPLRNNMSEKTLHSLVLFSQEYTEERVIDVPVRLIELYTHMRDDVRLSKIQAEEVKPKGGMEEEENNDLKRKRGDGQDDPSEELILSQKGKSMKLNSDQAHTTEQEVKINLNPKEDSEDDNLFS